MKVWIKYTVTGWADSDSYKEEVAFRTNLLGPKHWSAMSMSGPERTISLHIEEDLAILFKLKYANAVIDKTVGTS